MLIETKGWISKLIIISNKIEQCQNDEQIEALFFAGFTGGVEDVIQIGNDQQDERIIIKIPYIERPLADDEYDLYFNHISAEMYNILVHKMGRLLERHFD